VLASAPLVDPDSGERVSFRLDSSWVRTHVPPGTIRAVESDEQGRFAVRFARDGSWYVVWCVGLDGFVERHDFITGGEGEDLDLGDVELTRGVTLTGWVRDADGRPIAGAEIRKLFPYVTHRNDFGEVPVARTDGTGAFRSSTFAYGRTGFFASAPGYVTAKLVVQVFGSKGPDVEFVLARDMPITGRVVGAPQGGRVVVFAERKSELRLEVRAPCDPDGGFRIEGLSGEGGALSLTARVVAPNGRLGLLTDALIVEPGETDVVLRVIESTGFRLRVVDARSGRSLAADPVLRVPSDGMPMSIHTEVVAQDDGSVVAFALLHEGIFMEDPVASLWVDCPGYTSYRIRGLVPAPGSIVELGRVELEPLEPRTVRVTRRSDGAPVSGVLVESCLDPENVHYHGNKYEADILETRKRRIAFAPQRASATTDANGTAQLFLGGSGALGITAKHPEYVDLEFRTTVEESGNTLVLQLEEGGSVDVRCVDGASGLPLLGLYIFADSEGQGWSRRETLDVDGLARFRRLRPGPYRFEIEGEWEGSIRRVVVRGEERQELLLERTPRTRLFGVVTENGRPLAGAGVQYSIYEEWTDVDGKYSIDGLAANTEEIGVIHPEFGEVDAYELELTAPEMRHDIDLSFLAVRGGVLRENGDPVAGALVRLAKKSQDGRFELWEMEPWGGALHKTSTDSDGAFRFARVRHRAGLFLEVHHGNAVRRAGPLEFAEGALEHVEDVTMQDGASVQVRLLDWIGMEQGLPEVVATWIGAGSLPEEDREREAESLETRWGDMDKLELLEGTYLFSGLPPGRWRIQARDGFGFSQDGDTPPGAARDVTLRVGDNPEIVLRGN